MEEKFHRESARIYTFVAAGRPAPGERIEPRLFSADVVPLRCDTPRPPEPAPADPILPRADFGSGWYHDAAIEGAGSYKH